MNEKIVLARSLTWLKLGYMNEKIVLALDRITVFFLCGLIFILPGSKSMVEVFFGCAFLSFFIRMALKYKEFSVSDIAGKIRESGFGLALAVFIFVNILSIFGSVSFFLSLEGFFCKLLEGVLFFFIVSKTINSPRRIKWILISIFLSAFIVAIDGVFQAVRGADFLRAYPLWGKEAVRACFNNPNDFAAWLTTMIPLVLSIVYFGKNKEAGIFKRVRVPFLWVLLTLLTWCLILTRSRGGWIAGILAVVFIGILKDRKIVIGLILVLATLFFSVPLSYRERACSLLTALDMSRISLWKEAIDIIKDFPLLGTGPNTYSIVSADYSLNDITKGFYPHNSYLHLAAETGILGLAAFMWFIFSFFKTALKTLKESSGFKSVLLIGLVSAFSAFLFHSFVDTNFYSLQLNILMWFIMGMISGISRVEEF